MSHTTSCPTAKDANRYIGIPVFTNLARSLRAASARGRPPGGVDVRGGTGRVVMPGGAAMPPPRPRTAPTIIIRPGAQVVRPGGIPAGAPPGQYVEAPAGDDAAMMAEIEAILSALMGLDDEALMATMGLNPWLVQFLQDLGLLPAPDGGQFIGIDARDVRAADDAFSSVWDAVKGFVPYGNVIDQAHQARREMMWGPDARGGARGGADVDGTIRRMQSLSRRKRKGETAATTEVQSLKRRAARDTQARREWHVYVAVTRDDQRRIDGV